MNFVAWAIGAWKDCWSTGTWALLDQPYNYLTVTQRAYVRSVVFSVFERTEADLVVTTAKSIGTSVIAAETTLFPERGDGLLVAFVAAQKEQKTSAAAPERTSIAKTHEIKCIADEATV